jgi:hypothetical protein
MTNKVIFNLFFPLHFYINLGLILTLALYIDCLQCIYAELYKMICAENDTFQDIMISSVMLPNAAGNALEKALEANTEGKCLSLN